MTQVNINIFEAAEIPFEDEAMEKIEKANNYHIILDKDSTPVPY